VLGTVLCCPGCFSLYRVDALRDVLLEYSTSVTEANDFLTKDMGEDRWLCTLLVLKGWRLDYTAVATNYTYCTVIDCIQIICVLEECNQDAHKACMHARLFTE
jgi:cellulose synthase/poly-beta-1,6-N-acetylglucosamine synthase-like glycosyltransferase